jgi:hypothetical protein
MRVPKWAILFGVAGAVWMQPARGQAVISARSGLVHFFEGSVSVAGQPLASHLGKYVTIPDGGELRTERGRAEVLLTPGVFLRVGEKSAIRLVNSSLADSQVELVSGSAILDSTDAGAGRLATLIYKNWKITQAQKGIYRLDSDPPRVSVREGEVEVAAAGAGSPVSVSQGTDMPLAAVLAPEKSGDDSHDSLSQWADGRSQSIATDNAISANIQDPASMPATDPLEDSFTYFPLLGVPSYPSSLSGVGAVGVYESPNLYPGFYSMYLPGYVRPPALIGLGAFGMGAFGLQHSPLQLSPIQRSPLQRAPFSPSRPLFPISPMPRSPVGHAPPVAHPMPHVGGGAVHVGGHR